jgi:hypothetical protein
MIIKMIRKKNLRNFLTQLNRIIQLLAYVFLNVWLIKDQQQAEELPPL